MSKDVNARHGVVTCEAPTHGREGALVVAFFAAKTRREYLKRVFDFFPEGRDPRTGPWLPGGERYMALTSQRFSGRSSEVELWQRPATQDVLGALVDHYRDAGGASHVEAIEKVRRRVGKAFSLR